MTSFRAVLLVLALGVDTTGAFHAPLAAGSRRPVSIKSVENDLLSDSPGAAPATWVSVLEKQKEKV